MSESQPLISVVLPCYNTERYLSECLESLLKQNIPDMEIICVNDGSTDGTLEILCKYAEQDKRFTILDGPNGGYGKAMNRGLDAARGKYFALLEPDDMLAEGAYKKLLEAVEKYDLDFVKGDVHLFKKENGQIRTWKRQYKRVSNIVMKPRDYPKLLTEMFPATWAGVYRMEFLKKHGIRYIETPGASFQDMSFFFLTGAYAERALFIDDVVYKYRTMHETSSCANRGKMPYALRDVYLYVREKLEQTPEIWEKFKIVYLTRRVDGHSWIYHSLPLSIRPEYLEITRKEFIDYEFWDRSLLGGKKRYLEELLISVENFLMCESMRAIISSQIKGLERMSILQLKYKDHLSKIRRYSILAFFSIGKRKKRILEKKEISKKIVKEYEDLVSKKIV